MSDADDGALVPLGLRPAPSPRRRILAWVAPLLGLLVVWFVAGPRAINIDALAAVVLTAMGLTNYRGLRMLVVIVCCGVVYYGMISGARDEDRMRSDMRALERRSKEQRAASRTMRRELRRQTKAVNEIPQRTFDAVIAAAPMEARGRAAKLSKAIMAHAASCDARMNSILNRRPSRFTSEGEFKDYGAEITTVNSDCVNTFQQRFAGPALGTFNELRAQGVPEATLSHSPPFEHSVRYPTNILGIKDVGGTLGAMSVGSAEREIRELRDTVASLEGRHNALEARQAARMLTADQRQSLLDALRASPGDITIWASMGGPAESWKYGSELIQVFRDARWNVRAAQHPEAATGLVVVVGGDADAALRERQNFVADALIGAAIPDVTKEIVTTFKKASGLILFVGERPG